MYLYLYLDTATNYQANDPRLVGTPGMLFDILSREGSSLQVILVPMILHYNAHQKTRYLEFYPRQYHNVRESSHDSYLERIILGYRWLLL